MALTLEANTEEVWDLETYMEFLSRNVDVHDEASVAASAEGLKRLANNRSFLREIIHEELLDWRDFQAKNSYTAQTMVIAQGDNCFVRANIWMPPSQLPGVSQQQDDLFLYRVPHDHNFTFLTAGYWGSGYETEIYEYDAEGLAGLPGETVELRFLERTRLDCGKLMMYRAGKDIHSQHHPEEFSISLNLMVTPPDVGLREQYFFDLEEQKISRFVSSGISSRAFLCHIAGHVGDDQTCSILEEIVERHPCPRTRTESVRAMSRLMPSEEERLWRHALEDEHPHVRFAAEQQIEGRSDS